MRKTVLFSLLIVAASYTQAQDTLYVDIDATGANDGTTWANAYTDLEVALSNTADNDEVWIAYGRYKLKGSDRTASFYWNSENLKVYGSFKGNETSIDQRSSFTPQTILSGDLGIADDNSDNAYTVLEGPRATSFADIVYTAYINGVKISGGLADSTASTGISKYNSGAGFYLSPFVANVRFEQCEFSLNRAQYGGAVAVSIAQDAGASVSFTNCRFWANSASKSAVSYIDVSGNNGLSVNFYNCLMENNEVNDAISDGQESTLIYFYGSSTLPTAALNIMSCTMADNLNIGTGQPTSSKSTITVGSVTRSQSLDVNIYNSILWNNSQDSFFIGRGAATNYTIDGFFGGNSIFPKSTAIPTLSVSTRSLIFDTDPQFVSNNNYTLKSTSPAVNAGRIEYMFDANAKFTEKDIAGTTRQIDTIDIGCYEYNPRASIRKQIYNTAKVYPNPATTLLNISDLQGQAEVSILNLLGSEMLNTNSTQNIDIADLAPGVYTVRISQNGVISQAKFIKQ